MKPILLGIGIGLAILILFGFLVHSVAEEQKVKDIEALKEYAACVKAHPNGCECITLYPF